MTRNLTEVCRDEVEMLGFEVSQNMLCARRSCPAIPVSEVLQTRGEK